MRGLIVFLHGLAHVRVHHALRAADRHGPVFRVAGERHVAKGVCGRGGFLDDNGCAEKPADAVVVGGHVFCAGSVQRVPPAVDFVAGESDLRAAVRPHGKVGRPRPAPRAVALKAVVADDRAALHHHPRHAAAGDGVAGDDSARAFQNRNHRRHAARPLQLIAHDARAGAVAHADGHQAVLDALVVQQRGVGFLLHAQSGGFIFLANIADDRRARAVLDADARQLVGAAAITADQAHGLFVLHANARELVLETIVVLNHRLCPRARADAGHLVVVAGVAANDRPRALLGADAGHLVFETLVAHNQRRGAIARADAGHLVFPAAIVADDRRRVAAPRADARHHVLETLVALNDRPRPVARADAGHLVFPATIAPDERRRAIVRADAGHVILITLIALHQRIGLPAGADADARAPVAVALVAAQHRLGTLGHADAGAHVFIAHIFRHRRAGVHVANAGIKILETSVAGDERGGAPHRADAAAHVSVAKIAGDERRHAPVFRAGNANACVADVMDDVVRHRAIVPHLDAGRARRANFPVLLFIALRGVVLLPKRIVVLAHAGDGESIQRRALRHRHARPLGLRNVAINNCRLSTTQTQLALRVIAGASKGDARFQAEAFGVRSRCHQHRVPGLR